MVKNLSATQETRVLSLGREDTLEKGMATRSSIFVWRIPGTEEPGGLQSTGLERIGRDQHTHTHTHTHTQLYMKTQLQLTPPITLLILCGNSGTAVSK